MSGLNSTYMKIFTAHVRRGTAPFAVFVVTCLMVFGVHVTSVRAQTWQPFGGPILTTMVCTCTPSVWLVIVGPPVPAALSYVSGSMGYFKLQHAIYNVDPGALYAGSAIVFYGVSPGMWSLEPGHHYFHHGN